MVVKSPFVMHHGLIDTLFRDYSLAQANASTAPSGADVVMMALDLSGPDADEGMKNDANNSLR